MLNFFDGTFLVVVITRDVAQHVFFIFGFILYLKDGGWDGMGMQHLILDPALNTGGWDWMGWECSIQFPCSSYSFGILFSVTPGSIS